MNFTSEDIDILRTGLELLNINSRQILIYRFWENMSIEEISHAMSMSWAEVDESIKNAQEYLNDSA